MTWRKSGPESTVFLLHQDRYAALYVQTGKNMPDKSFKRPNALCQDEPSVLEFRLSITFGYKERLCALLLWREAPVFLHAPPHY